MGSVDSVWLILFVRGFLNSLARAQVGIEMGRPQRKLSLSDDVWDALMIAFKKQGYTWPSDLAEEALWEFLGKLEKNPEKERIGEISAEIGKSARRVGNIHFSVTTAGKKLRRDLDDLKISVEEELITPEKAKDQEEKLRLEYQANVDRELERQRREEMIESETQYNDKKQKRKFIKKILQTQNELEWEFMDGDLLTKSELENRSNSELIKILDERGLEH
jgi:hypothetical protein